MLAQCTSSPSMKDTKARSDDLLSFTRPNENAACSGKVYATVPLCIWKQQRKALTSWQRTDNSPSAEGFKARSSDSSQLYYFLLTRDAAGKPCKLLVIVQ